MIWHFFSESELFLVLMEKTIKRTIYMEYGMFK